MKKDAFYFPHFSNARHDRKIKRVLKDLGVEGYGLFFMLLEVLREQTDLKYPLSDVDLLADEFGTSVAKLKAIIAKYDLFQTDSDGKFFSIKQIFYLQPYFEKSERAREAANLRWKNTKLDANALPSHSERNASKVKESKLNESEGKQRKAVEPDLEQFEKWTREIISGQDFFFHQKFQNEIPNWGGAPEKFVELMNGHLELLNRYPAMNPNTQQRFRNSAIKHIKEQLAKEANGKSKQRGFDVDGAKDSISDYLAKHG